MKKILVFLLILFVISWCGKLNNFWSLNNVENNKTALNYDMFQDSVEPDVFEKLINTWKFIVLDIRTLEELQYFGYISGMNLHFDFYSPSDVKKILNLDKNKKYLIYCYHWNRSKILKEKMKVQWFTVVIDLKWGVDAWIKSWRKLKNYIEKK